MKKKLLILACILFSAIQGSAQMGIGTFTPDSSAVLDLSTTNKGFLMPRLTMAQRNAIAGPAAGLLIYQTNNTPGYYYYTGSTWVPLISASGTDWTTSGNAGTNPVSNFIGTTDNQSLSIRTNGTEAMRIDSVGNISIGLSSTSNRLELDGTYDLHANGYHTLYTDDLIPAIAPGLVFVGNKYGLQPDSLFIINGILYAPQIGDTLHGVVNGVLDFTKGINSNMTVKSDRVDMSSDSAEIKRSSIQVSYDFGTEIFSTDGAGFGFLKVEPHYIQYSVSDGIDYNSQSVNLINTQNQCVDLAGQKHFNESSSANMRSAYWVDSITMYHSNISETAGSLVYSSYFNPDTITSILTIDSSFTYIKTDGNTQRTIEINQDVHLHASEGPQNSDFYLKDSSYGYFNGNGLTDPFRLGIGQVPAEALDVNGKIRSTELAGGGNLIADVNGNIILGTSAVTDWTLTGNTGTNSGTNFLGTTDNNGLSIRTNSTEAMHIDSLGNVSIGVGNTNYKFEEKGIFNLHHGQYSMLYTDDIVPLLLPGIKFMGGIYHSYNGNEIAVSGLIKQPIGPDTLIGGVDGFLNFSTGEQNTMFSSNISISLRSDSAGYKGSLLGMGKNQISMSTYPQPGITNELYLSENYSHQSIIDLNGDETSNRVSPAHINFRNYSPTQQKIGFLDFTDDFYNMHLEDSVNMQRTNMHSMPGRFDIETNYDMDTIKGYMAVDSVLNIGINAGNYSSNIHMKDNIELNLYNDGDWGGLILEDSSVAYFKGTMLFKLGIGQINPQEALDVLGTIRSSSLAGGGTLEADANGNIIVGPPSGAGWLLAGNTGTNSGTDFIGTTDAQNLTFKTDNTARMTLKVNGSLELLGVNQNTFIGMNVGLVNTGGNNTFIGTHCGESSTTTSFTTIIGDFAGNDLTIGSKNSFFGHGAGQFTTNGDENCFYGFLTGKNNTTGYNNVFIGSSSGYANDTGKYNLAIGHQADFGSSGLLMASAIGANAICDSSREMVFGSSQVKGWGFGMTPINGNVIQNSVNSALLTAGGVWTNASDINIKDNIVNMNGAEVLNKISHLQITRWNYKNESPGITHIGPMAQDFYALFHTGADDTHISTIDPAGVALIGVQELTKENIQLKEQLDQQNADIQAMLLQLQTLQQQINAIQGGK